MGDAPSVSFTETDIPLHEEDSNHEANQNVTLPSTPSRVVSALSLALSLSVSEDTDMKVNNKSPVPGVSINETSSIDILPQDSDNIDLEDLYADIDIVKESIINPGDIDIEAQRGSISGSDFFCFICYDTVPLRPSRNVTKLSCGHRYCKSCFANYVKSKVTEGQVSLTCFHPLENENKTNEDISGTSTTQICGATISSRAISMALSDDPDTLRKYKRFTSLKGNTAMRECCFCNNIQLGNPDIPSILCTKCKKVYCYYHANAHSADETCEQYEARVQAAQKESNDFIAKNSKKCPKCGVPIWKIDGCNHMKCTVCSQAFCWICGKQIDDAVFPAHFQWWNPSGCSNMQMNEAIEPSRWARLSARMLTWIEIVLLGPLTLATTVGSLILCSCCLPHYLMTEDESADPLWIKLQRLTSNCMSGWGIFWIGVVFFLPAAFILLGLAIGFGSAAFVLVYPIYAAYRLYNRQYPWPDRVTRLLGSCRDWFMSCFSTIYCCCSCCCCSLNGSVIQRDFEVLPNQRNSKQKRVVNQIPDISSPPIDTVFVSQPVEV